MSFWVPKRGKDGRWSLYSVSFPIQLAILAFAMLVLLIMMIAIAIARAFR
jgi:hypothetical protein